MGGRRGAAAATGVARDEELQRAMEEKRKENEMRRKSVELG